MAGSHCEPYNGEDGIAGTGNIIHFPGPGIYLKRFAILLKKNHPILAAGYQELFDTGFI
jgi:hypothetical protein